MDDIPRRKLEHVAAVSPAGWTGTVFTIVMENKSRGDILGNRDAPYISQLVQQGAVANGYHDPYVPFCMNGKGPMTSVPLDETAIAAADCVVILTDHPEFDYRQIVDTSPLVIDTRGATWGMPTPAERVVGL